MIDHFNVPLKNKAEETENQISSFSAGFQSARLDEGKLGFFDTVEEKAYDDIVKNFTDYKDNQTSYDAFLSTDDIPFGNHVRDMYRKKYNNAIEDNIYELDENNNLVEGNGYNMLADLLFDKETMKGFLLARKNGLNDDMLNTKYQEIVKAKKNELEKAEEGFWGNLGGTLTGYLASEETLSDFASPGKIMASSIGKGFIKATGVEAAYISAGEIMREDKRQRHAAHMEDNRSLWDGTKEILINSGFGGLIRGIGSAIWDGKTMSDIHKRIGQFENSDDALTDRQIFAQFAQRENERLHTNVNAHNRILDEAELQMEKGKKVDIAEATDIPFESKIGDNETIDIVEEINNVPEVQQDKEFFQTLQKEVDDSLQQETDINYYDDELINNYMEDIRLSDDPEVKQILIDIENINKYEKPEDLLTHPRIEELLTMREDVSASDIQYKQKLVQGKQIIEDKQRLGGENNTMYIPAQYETNYLADFVLTKSDVKKIRSGNIDASLAAKLQQDLSVLDSNPLYAEKQIIKDTIPDEVLTEQGLSLNESGDIVDQNGKVLFAKFTDNLAAGTIAGIEIDEEGNVSFNPEAFVAGLGGYTAIKQMYKAGIFDSLPKEVNKWVKNQFGVDLEMGIVERQPGESIFSYIQRKKADPDYVPPEIPKPKQKNIPKIDKNNLPFTDKMKKNTIQKKYTKPKGNVYRGESENTGSGLAMFGQGTYSTTNKTYAKKFGNVREVNQEELPNNPLQFSNELEFKQFEYEFAKELGIDKRDIPTYIGEVDEYIQKIGYDGLTIGSGKDKIFVKFYPKKENK